MLSGREAASAPSGDQVEIVHGTQRATIVEVGGGLRTYLVDGLDLLDGYAVDEMCSGGRGQVLMPWPNRIDGGSYDFGGQRRQLPLTEVANGNAIHGLVRWAAWSIAERQDDAVVMRHVLHPQPGFPWSLDLAVQYRLGPGGLKVRTSARNIGTAECPFGSGAHPYLSVGSVPVDDVIVVAPGRQHLHADARGIPVGRTSAAGTDLDLRRPAAVGQRRLDDCFTDLERDGDGSAWVRLSSADGARQVSLWMDRSYDYLMLFTGDTLPDGGRRSIAVEPMTCAPNAFRSGDGLIVLSPGEAFEGHWGIVPGFPER